MVRIGLIGLGGMGNMHFGVYEGLADAEVVAIADADEKRLKPGESALAINIGEGGAKIDPDKHRLYTNADELIADPDVDIVDICLPTFLHAEHMIRAIEAGKNVLCEKPMAMNSEECQRVLAVLKGKGVKLMIAQCLRFWPEYVYLKETVESGRFGRVLGASFWRGSALPDWSWDGWLQDATRSGGAILDLHVHDVDMVHHVLGRPKAVCSTGAIGATGGYDIVDSVYVYDDKMSVHSGANMGMPAAFGFEMRFTVAFEKGCLVYSTKNSPPLMEITADKEIHPELKQTDGYHEEIAYLVRCVKNNEMPAVITPESAAYSIKLAEAEIKSVETGKLVKV